MHGTFGIALAMGMQTAAVEFADPIVGALGLNDWRFRKPLLIGDTVHVEIEFLSRRVTRGRQRAIRCERRLSLMRQRGRHPGRHRDRPAEAAGGARRERHGASPTWSSGMPGCGRT